MSTPNSLPAAQLSALIFIPNHLGDTSPLPGPNPHTQHVQADMRTFLTPTCHVPYTWWHCPLVAQTKYLRGILDSSCLFFITNQSSSPVILSHILISHLHHVDFALSALPFFRPFFILEQLRSCCCSVVPHHTWDKALTSRTWPIRPYVIWSALIFCLSLHSFAS